MYCHGMLPGKHFAYLAHSPRGAAVVLRQRTPRRSVCHLRSSCCNRRNSVARPFHNTPLCCWPCLFHKLELLRRDRCRVAVAVIAVYVRHALILVATIGKARWRHHAHDARERSANGPGASQNGYRPPCR